MATLKEIAKIVGVSNATVSRVLNHDETILISPKTRKQIFETAEQLQYRPPRQRRANTTGNVVIGVADWHIIHQEMANIKLSSLHVIAASATDRPVRFLRLRAGHTPDESIDGIIAFGNYESDEMAYLRRISRRIIFVNNDERDYHYDRIVMDFDCGMRYMVDHLLEKGHHQIGYLGGILDNGPIQIGRRRLDSLRRILEGEQLYRPELFHVGEISMESGWQLAETAIRKSRLGRAILLGNDETARGALAAFAHAGLSIPGDVAVVLYRDIDTLPPVGLDYTTLHMLPDFVWETAIKLLLERIEERRSDMMTVILPSKLLPGQST